MTKPHTALIRPPDFGSRPSDSRHLVVIGTPNLRVGSWSRSDDKAPEQVHLLIYTGVLAWPFLVAFKDPGTLDQFIEDLSRCRREVWPAAQENPNEP